MLEVGCAWIRKWYGVELMVRIGDRTDWENGIHHEEYFEKEKLKAFLENDREEYCDNED